MQLYESKTWSLYQDKPNYTSSLKHWWRPIVIVCDGVEYPVTRSTTNYNEKLVLGLIELCKQISPITATYIEHESIGREIKESTWQYSG